MTKNNYFIKSKKNPIILFKEWFNEAKRKEINDPNAMNLSTISKNLKPSSRVVLLKSFDENGFVFYTNIKSRKGNSIFFSSYVALNFYWKSLKKQVRIEGRVSQVSNKQADMYFNTRTEESRIGSWASKQSQVLRDRKILLEKISQYQKKFRNKSIPRPSYWTGFRVKPKLIEFWKEMPHRLHDRIEYKKKQKDWISRRLYP